MLKQLLGTNPPYKNSTFLPHTQASYPLSHHSNIIYWVTITYGLGFGASGSSPTFPTTVAKSQKTEKSRKYTIYTLDELDHIHQVHAFWQQEYTLEEGLTHYEMISRPSSCDFLVAIRAKMQKLKVSSFFYFFQLSDPVV